MDLPECACSCGCQETIPAYEYPWRERTVCQDCWSGKHERKNAKSKIPQQDAVLGFELRTNPTAGVSARLKIRSKTRSKPILTITL